MHKFSAKRHLKKSGRLALKFRHVHAWNYPFALQVFAFIRCKTYHNRMKQVVFVTLLICFAVFPSLGRSEEAPPRGALSFILENDLFYNTDRHYTNGVRILWVPEQQRPLPKWMERFVEAVPWFPEQRRIRQGYGLGQSMFTPRNITVRHPVPGERPYAGWLYVTIGLGVETGRRLDQLGLTLGVVGPASLAGPTQKFVHSVVGADKPRGWGNQLRNEPGLVITSQRSWRSLARVTLLGSTVDVTPNLGIALGNVFTHGKAGVTLRYGRNLPRDYGPPLIQSGLPGSGDFSPKADFGWYLFAGVEGRAVARNIFLDGNSFRNSNSVKKRPLVGDLQFGAVLDWPAFRLSYTHVLRTREFKTQTSKDNFGSVNLTVKF